MIVLIIIVCVFHYIIVVIKFIKFMLKVKKTINKIILL